METDLEELFDKHPIVVSLKNEGHNPSFYKRGNVYRSHIDKCGNFWEDSDSPITAIEKAVENWKKYGVK